MDDDRKKSNPGCLLCMVGMVVGFIGFAIAYSGVMSDDVQTPPNDAPAILFLALGAILFLIGLIAKVFRR